MADGDAASAIGLAILNGLEKVKDMWKQINASRDMIANHITSGTHNASQITAGVLDAARIPVLDGATKITGNVPGAGAIVNGANYITWDVANARWAATADIQTPGSLLAGGNVIAQSHFYAPNAIPVTSGFVALYRNGDGRIGITPSSIRFKNPLGQYELPAGFMDLQPQVYALKDDPAQVPRLGFYAEDVNEVEPLLVVHEDGSPFSIRYESWAVPLHAALQRALARIDDLERLGAAANRRITELENGAPNA